MKLSKYIKTLQTFLETNPEKDLEVVMTQSGYYSDGQLADLYDVPEVCLLGYTKNKVLCLGHSHQSY